VASKKLLDKNHTLYVTTLFPASLNFHGGKKALLGLGGNLGDVIRRFEHLLYYLQRSGFLRVIETTPILKNPPFGYEKQGDFYNTLFLVETQLTAKMLLRYVLRVERVFGRKRSFKDAPRTLDIDIIFYDKLKMDTKELILPHPSWKHRSSVLIPLSYLSIQAQRFFNSEIKTEQGLPKLLKRKQIR